MGFLGIVLAPDGPKFEVPEVHINLWVLPGLLGRHVVYFDIGIHLCADPAVPLESFCVVLPAATTDEVTDLADVFKNKDAAQLIFGERVDVMAEQLKFIDGESVPILRISSSLTCRDNKKSSPSFSRWDIRLARPLTTKGYVRLRFRIRTRGHMLLMRGYGMLASRILADLRVSDPRESATVPDGALYEEALVTIGKLYCYVMLPARFHSPSASPEMHYIRILEGSTWEPYLGRATYLLRQGKLTVYCWYHLEPITMNRPFRAFIDVKRDTRVLLPYSFLLTIVATVLTVLLLLDPSLVEHSRMAGVLEFVNQALRPVLVALGATTIIGALFAAWRRRTALKSTTDRAARALLVVENSLYRLRMKR
jgi:hypothetical protein